MTKRAKLDDRRIRSGSCRIHGVTMRSPTTQSAARLTFACAFSFATMHLAFAEPRAPVAPATAPGGGSVGSAGVAGKGRPGRADSASAASASAAPSDSGPSAPVDVLGTGPAPVVFATKPNGVTADIAASRAVSTSKAIKIDNAKLAAAAAQVDLAWDTYLPRLSGIAKYTRLSQFTPPPFFTPTTMMPGAAPIPAPKQVLDNGLFQATLTVPFSDYVFKIWDARKGAIAAREAVQWNAKVDAQVAATNARVAFYNWLRARGSLVVTQSAVEQYSAHLNEIRAKLEARAATNADLYEAEARVADAQLTVLQSQNLVVVNEANLRTQMHLSDQEPLESGEDLDAELAPLVIDVRTLRATAFSKRPELRAFHAQIAAQEANIKVQVATAYPRVDGGADVIYASPNPRYFPATPAWNATWDAYIQLTWSPNDMLTALDNKKSTEADLASLKAQKEQMEDALGLDVINAYTLLREKEASVATTATQRRSAEEGYRVRVEQFRGGFTTSFFVLDAAQALTSARINELFARVDVRIARVQLKKAIGDL